MKMKNKSKIARTPKLSMTKDTFVRTTGKAIVAASVVGVALLGTVTPAAANPAPKAVKILDTKTGTEVTAYKFQMATKNSTIQAGAEKPLCFNMCIGQVIICTGSYTPE